MSEDCCPGLSAVNFWSRSPFLCAVLLLLVIFSWSAPCFQCPGLLRGKSVCFDHTCTYTSTCTCTNTHIQTHCTHTHTYICIYANTCAHTHNTWPSLFKHLMVSWTWIRSQNYGHAYALTPVSNPILQVPRSHASSSAHFKAFNRVDDRVQYFTWTTALLVLYSLRGSFFSHIILSIRAKGVTLVYIYKMIGLDQKEPII